MPNKSSINFVILLIFIAIFILASSVFVLLYEQIKYSNRTLFALVCLNVFAIAVLSFQAFVIRGLIKNISLSELLSSFAMRIFLVIFSVLLVVSIAYSIKAISSFYSYKKIDNSAKLDIDGFLFLVTNEAKKDYYSFVAKPLDNKDSIPSFFITINHKHLKKLDSNLPSSGKDRGYKGQIKINPYVPLTYGRGSPQAWGAARAALPYPEGIKAKINDGKAMKMKMRYRGDGNYHWFYKQKSLRIDLKEDGFVEMEQKFNLINPPQSDGFTEIASYQIAKKLGIISPECYPVKVFINGEYFGVYLYVSQVDEGLLRKQKLMPGSIYYGDGGVPKYKGYSDLWFKPEYWIKKSSRNKEEEAFRGDINLFIEKINDPSELVFYKFFNQYADKKTFYSFIALDRITGGGHHDISHNHKIYFDPYKGKFEPIEWDLRSWFDQKEKDVSYNHIVRRINLNPILSYELDKLTYELYKTNLEEELFEIYETNTINAKNALEADRYKDNSTYIFGIFNQNPARYSVPYSYERQLAQIERNHEILKNRKKIIFSIFEEVDLKLLPSKKGNEKVLKYYVAGNSPIKIDFSNLNCAVTRIYGGKRIPINPLTEEILYPGRKTVLDESDLIGRGDKSAVPAYEEYVYVIGDQSVVDVGNSRFVTPSHDGVQYKNAITESEVKPEIVRSFKRDAESIHPWEIAEKPAEKITLQGVIKVSHDMFFEKHQEVIIKPGTEFIISPKKSIFFFGKVTAKGTKNSPIKFLPKDKKNPFGSVAIQGKDSSNSVFEYVKFAGGSVSENALIKYTAQFNIHDSDNFLIKNCSFGKNKIGDDNVHVAYSNGVIDSSVFFDAAADALDVDISNVEVTNSSFINSGNDGLDIMTSEVKADGDIFINNGDKGISVGEWSKLDVRDSVMLNANIGLAVKDKTRAVMKNMLIVKSKTEAISAYNKNPRYDEGGFIEASNIFILGNDKISSDKKSKIDIAKPEATMQIKDFGWYKNIRFLPKNEQNLLLNLEN